MTMPSLTPESTPQAPSVGIVSSDWLAASRESIKQAKKFADAHEVRLGWFVLRDTEAVKRSGMSDLAWSGHKEGVTLGELRWFIGELERFLSANIVHEPHGGTNTNNHSL